VLVGGSDGRRSQFGDSGPVSGPHSDSGPHGFSHTSIHPLSTGLASFDEAPGHSSLDLNLDEPPPGLAAEQQSQLLDFALPDASAPADSHASRTRH
jgi:hypothetical protein